MPSTDHRWLLCSCLSTCEPCKGWFHFPFHSAQLCPPLGSLMALQPLLAEGFGTSRVAIPEIQVRGRKGTRHSGPALGQASCMAWGPRLQPLKPPASRFFQVSYGWAPGGSKIGLNPSAPCLPMAKGPSAAWLTFNCPLSQQNCCSAPP